MKILAIESSCDDTSVALVDCSTKGFFVISEKTASQIEVHKKYGGVVPEVAGRQHAENILPVIEYVLARTPNSKLLNPNSIDKPDVIAVTAGPGLITGLVVGVEVAKTLSYLWEVPLVGVNHIAGHVHSVQLMNHESRIMNHGIDYPALALVVSGGHTELLLMKDPTTFELIGKTRDDAAGEAFDKVGKLLGFDYPGGPKISEHAANGNPEAIKFPRPMTKKGNFSAKGRPASGWDFSFSGLKTAALYHLRDHEKKGVRSYDLGVMSLNDFCSSFEQAIVDTLVTKTIRAAKKYKPKSIILGGGVSANKKLCETLKAEISRQTPILNFQFPVSDYAMDNAAMIAVAGYYKAIKKDFTNWKDIEANPNWRVYNT
jgi:N6-L-threonylcarbamoyladenine synthase